MHDCVRKIQLSNNDGSSRSKNFQLIVEIVMKKWCQSLMTRLKISWFNSNKWDKLSIRHEALAIFYVEKLIVERNQCLWSLRISSSDIWGDILQTSSETFRLPTKLILWINLPKLLKSIKVFFLLSKSIQNLTLTQSQFSLIKNRKKSERQVWINKNPSETSTEMSLLRILLMRKSGKVRKKTASKTQR